MIIVRVELHSAVTGKMTELARMHIANTGIGTLDRCDYTGETFVGRDTRALDRGRINHTGVVVNWPRQTKHVWCLVHRMLVSMGYAK
jgi:hypothetical protein